jgi:TPR repeat protein
MSMKSYAALAFAALVLALASISSAAQERDHFLANIDYSLSKESLLSLSDEGMEGSALSAAKVMNYYIFVKRDCKKSMVWALIAAENGSPEAQFMTYQLLADSRKHDDQRRALFWLGMAAKSGYLGADAIYSVCNSITARHTDHEKTPCFGPNAESAWPF